MLALVLQSSTCGWTEELLFVCHTGLKVHFARWEASIGRELSIPLYLVHTGNLPHMISLSGLKYNGEERSPQQLVPRPLLISQQLQ